MLSETDANTRAAKTWAARQAAAAARAKTDQPRSFRESKTSKAKGASDGDGGDDDAAEERTVSGRRRRVMRQALAQADAHFDEHYHLANQKARLRAKVAPMFG